MGPNWITASHHGCDTITFGTDDHDKMYLSDQNDCAAGGDGYDYIDGLAGHDRLYGQAGDDFLWGREGDDYLNGGAGDDYLIGGVGSDMMFGGSGDDALYGQFHGDHMIGGEGHDEFTFSDLGSQVSYIHDFEQGDRIRIDVVKQPGTEKEDFDLHVEKTSANWSAVSLEGHEVIRVYDHAHTLQESDIILI